MTGLWTLSGIKIIYQIYCREEEKKAKLIEILPSYTSRCFPSWKSDLESVNLFASYLIVKWGCFPDKEQETEFVHSLDFSLSSDTRVSPISELCSPKRARVPRKSPAALFWSVNKIRLLFTVDKEAQQSVFWLQPEFWPLTAFALRESDASSQSVFGPFRGWQTRLLEWSLSLTLNTVSHAHSRRCKLK